MSKDFLNSRHRRVSVSSKTVAPNASLYKNPDNDQRGPYLLCDVTSPGDRPSLQFEWNGHLPPTGRSWRYTEERAKELTADGKIVFIANGKPRLKRYLSDAQLPEPVDVESEPITSLGHIIRTAMKTLAAEIGRNPSCLKDVEWRDLERVLREVLEGLGFDTHLTRSGKDGGFDLRLTWDQAGLVKVVLVEVKHWIGSEKKPGRPILKAFFDVVARTANNATGLLLSSTGFTADVVSGRTEVEQHRVRLGGSNKIISLCQHYLRGVEGLWSPTSDLATMLLEGTL